MRTTWTTGLWGGAAVAFGLAVAWVVNAWVGASAGVRPLAPEEAATTCVGGLRVCNKECSKTKTNPCPTTLQDYCILPTNKKREDCINGEYANCWQCETTGGYKVCTTLFQSFC